MSMEVKWMKVNKSHSPVEHEDHSLASTETWTDHMFQLHINTRDRWSKNHELEIPLTISCQYLAKILLSEFKKSFNSQFEIIEFVYERQNPFLRILKI